MSGPAGGGYFEEAGFGRLLAAYPIGEAFLVSGGASDSGPVPVPDSSPDPDPGSD